MDDGGLLLVPPIASPSIRRHSTRRLIQDSRQRHRRLVKVLTITVSTSANAIRSLISRLRVLTCSWCHEHSIFHVSSVPETEVGVFPKGRSILIQRDLRPSARRTPISFSRRSRRAAILRTQLKLPAASASSRWYQDHETLTKNTSVLL